jgi:hypothetical protein
MRNVVTDTSGAIVKRKGTRVVYRNVAAYSNVTLMPVATALDYNLLCLKAGVDLEVYELNNNLATKLITKSNVWSSVVSQTRASWVLTSEPEPRLLIVTGGNKPVQVQFVEKQSTSSGGTSVVFSSAASVQLASTSNAILWVNRQRYTGSVSYSYNSGTQQLTATLGTSLTSGDVVDITVICWQWWAEAQHWYGDRLFGSETRFNAVPADQVVKIPSRLTVDLDPTDNVARSWSTYAWRESSRLSVLPAFTRVTTGKPNTDLEYWFSDGKRYNYSTNNITNASPFYITYGRTMTTATSPSTVITDPTTVFFTRDRSLKFRGGTGQSTSLIDVYVDGTLRTRYTAVAGSTYLQYGLKDSAKAFLSGAGTAYYVEFAAEAQIGVNPLSYAEFVNKEATHIGSAATTSRYSASTVDGSYVPIYGLGVYADYLNGFYPSVVSTYQNRIVLGGFNHRPMLVLFSNVSDSVTAGTRYNFFQITDDDLALRDTSPFDVELDKRGSDDRVVSLIEWERSLFVLARRATYRLSGSAEKGLKFDNKFVTFLSSTGCVNSNCVVQTETNINYLGDNGLYNLTPRIEDGEFKVDEKSLKIRKQFGATSDPSYEELAWLAYDPQEKYIYVGYPSTGNLWTSVFLYVYNTTRESWTEFDTQGYFRAFDAIPFVDRTVGQVFLMACTTEQNESGGSTQGRPENLILLKFSDSHYVDYYDIRGRASLVETYPTLQVPDIQFVTGNAWEQTFKHSYESIGQFRGYRPLPFTDVEDVVCYVSPPSAASSYLSYPGGWTKKPGDFFYINNRVPTGTSVSFRWKPNNGLVNAQGYSHMVVWVNRAVYTGWTLSGSGAVNDKYMTLPSSVPVNAFVEWGFIYSAVYSSPVFLNNAMPTQKRLKHLYLFFDNDGGQDVYRSFDVNTTQSPAQDPEEITDHYKTRVNANISVTYNANNEGFYNSDIYGFSDLYFDEGVFDYDPAAEQGHTYSLFKEPIQGVGYSYQASVWSYDEAKFKLSGYQITVRTKGQMYTGRF